MLSILLKDELWGLMMRFGRLRAISILSCLFCNDMRIKEVNRCTPMIFLNCHRRFSGLVLSSTPTNAQTVVGHISAIYQQAVEGEENE